MIGAKRRCLIVSPNRVRRFLPLHCLFPTFNFSFQLHLVSTTPRFSPARVIFPRFKAMANVNPPQPEPQLGPQPDFARLTQGFQQATTGFQQTTTGLQQTATELGNFANLPPFAQGNALIQLIQQLQQEVQQQTQQQQQFQQQMQQQMQQFQQSQQQMQQQIADLGNNIQAFRNEMRTSRRAT
jgi:hypothetical protein